MPSHLEQPKKLPRLPYPISEISECLGASGMRRLADQGLSLQSQQILAQAAQWEMAQKRAREAQREYHNKIAAGVHRPSVSRSQLGSGGSDDARADEIESALKTARGRKAELLGRQLMQIRRKQGRL